MDQHETRGQGHEEMMCHVMHRRIEQKASCHQMMVDWPPPPPQKEKELEETQPERERQEEKDTNWLALVHVGEPVPER